MARQLCRYLNAAAGDVRKEETKTSTVVIHKRYPHMIREMHAQNCGLFPSYEFDTLHVNLGNRDRSMDIINRGRDDLRDAVFAYGFRRK